MTINSRIPEWGIVSALAKSLGISNRGPAAFAETQRGGNAQPKLEDAYGDLAKAWLMSADKRRSKL